MYKVILQNGEFEYTLHNSSTDKIVSKLVSGNVSVGINSIPTFQFVFLPNNVGFERIVPYQSIIKIINLKNRKKIFHGRVLKVKPTMNEKGMISKSVICEGRLAYLCDSIQPYTSERKWSSDEDSTGLEKYIDYLLENHNNQVEEEKKIYRGKIEVYTLSKDNSVDKGTNYQNTFDIIQEKLVKIFGGEICIRESSFDGKLYLDYVNQLGKEKSTIISVSKNMKSIDEEIDYSNIFTRLIPLGSKIKIIDENGNETETEERVTIESVNNNKLWIDNELITTLGVITKKIEFDTISNPDELLLKAEDYIRNETMAIEKHNLNVLDLSIIDSSFDELEVGNIHSFKNALLNLDKKLRIIKQTIDICKPTSSNIVVGDSYKKLSDITISKSKDIEEVLQQITDIKTNYAKNTTVKNNYSELFSLIDQTYQNIVLMVSEEYVSNVEYEESIKKLSQLEMLIDKISLSVSEISVLSSKVSDFQVKLGEISQQVSASTDITVTDKGEGTIKLNDVATSELIMLKIHPTKTDLAYLYPSNTLYPSDDLYLLSRLVIFENTSTEEKIEYELPCDLWFLDDIYDEFIIDYEAQEAFVIHRIGFNSDGSKFVLKQEVTEQFKYNPIMLNSGNYIIKMLSFNDAYIFATCMVNNLYSAQHPTKTELKAAIKVTESKIEQSASVKVDKTFFEAYQTLTALEFSTRVKNGEIISSINQSAEKVKINANKIQLYAENILDILSNNSINMTSKNISITSTNFSVTKDGYLTAKNGKIANWNITDNALYKGSNIFGASGTGNMYFGNNGLSISNIFKVDSSGKLLASNVDLTGKITATSGSFTGSVNASSGKIGGFDIGSVAITSTYDNYRVYVGNASNASKDFLVVRTGTEGNYSFPFWVHGDGKLHAENADISGKITATSGSIAGNLVTTGINASNLTTGTVSSCNIDIYNSTGFLKMLKGSAYHPFVSALNVARGSGGIVFRSSGDRGSTGNNIGQIYADNNVIYVSASNGTNIANYLKCGNIGISGNKVRGNSDTEITLNYSVVLKPNPNGGAYVWGTEDYNKILTSGGSPSTLSVKEYVKEKDTSDIPEILKSIKLYDYKYIDKIENGKEDYGYIIDYLEQIPNITKYLKFYEAERNGIQFKQLAHEQISKFLLGAVVELQKEIEELERRLS